MIDTEIKKDDGSSFRNMLQKASEELLLPEESLDSLPGKDESTTTQMIFCKNIDSTVHLTWCNYIVP